MALSWTDHLYCSGMGQTPRDILVHSIIRWAARRFPKPQFMLILSGLCNLEKEPEQVWLDRLARRYRHENRYSQPSHAAWRQIGKVK